MTKNLEGSRAIIENSAVSFLKVGRLEGSIIQPADQRETQYSPVHGFRHSDQSFRYFPLSSTTHSVIDPWDGQHTAERREKGLMFKPRSKQGHFTGLQRPKWRPKRFAIIKSLKD